MTFFSNGHRRTPVVLGLKLQEFTLGHWLLLTELECPFFNPRDSRGFRADANPTDLFLAVFVCCQSHLKARESIDRWWFRLFLWIWSWKVRNLNGVKEVHSLEDYFRNALTGPTFTTQGNSDGGAEGGTPAVASLVAYLTGALNQPLTEALNCPVNTAVWVRAAHLDMKGHAQLWTGTREALWNAASNLREN